MNSDELESWLAADPDDIAGGIAFAQPDRGERSPTRPAKWAWAAVFLIGAVLAVAVAFALLHA